METSGRAMPGRPVIPIRQADCGAAEAFALQVLGEDMQPEFAPGDIIVVEPEGRAGEGSFVVARWQGEWALRQLRRDGGQWFLAALDGRSPPAAIPDLSVLRGVVIQKSRPGRRQSVKRYVD